MGNRKDGKLSGSLDNTSIAAIYKLKIFPEDKPRNQADKFPTI